MLSAMEHLHSYHYDPEEALQCFAEMPTPQCIYNKWNEEERKRFVRGLRQFGKNFFRIRKEFLPHKETSDLVEFYYIWKKTPSAINSRPHTRRNQNRPNSKENSKKPKNSSSSRPPSGEYLSSASEVSDNDSDESDGRDLGGYCCHHCFTTSSKDWHHTGKSKTLLCTDCRLHLKKYGEDRPLSDSEKHTPPPFLFRPVSEDGKSNVDSPDSSERKSPSSASTCSSSSELKDIANDKTKNQRDRTDSPIESSNESSLPGDEENAHDGDIENNHEEDVSCASSVCSAASVVSDCISPQPPDLQRDVDSDMSLENPAIPSLSSAGLLMSAPALPALSKNIPIPIPQPSIPIPVPTSCTSIVSSVSGSSLTSSSIISPIVPSVTVPRLGIASIPIPADLSTTTAALISSPSSILGSGDLINISGLSPSVTSRSDIISNRDSLVTGGGTLISSATVTTSLSSSIFSEVRPSASGKSSLKSGVNTSFSKPLATGLSPVNNIMLPGVHVPSSFVSSMSFSGIPKPSHSSSLISRSSSTSTTISRPSGLMFPGSSNPMSSIPKPVTTSPFSVSGGSLARTSNSSTAVKDIPIPTPVGMPPVSRSAPSRQSPPPLRKPTGQDAAMRDPSHPRPLEGLSRNSIPIPHLQGAGLTPLPPSHSSLSDLSSRSISPEKSSPSALGPPPPLTSCPGPPRLGSGLNLSLTSPRTTIKSEPGLSSNYNIPGVDMPIPTPTSFNIKQEKHDEDAESPTPVNNTPSPAPKSVSEEVHRSKSGVFIKQWWRGNNTCSRCDFYFRPSADSDFVKLREEKNRRRSDPLKIRDDRKDEKSTAGRKTPQHQLKRDQSPLNMSADGKNFLGAPSSSHSAMLPGRVTPSRLPYDPTPALRQLSEYARPHTLGAGGTLEARPMLPGMTALDPVLQRMYPQGSRELLELELQRDKQERDARERDLREREIRELEMRSRQKNELEALKNLPGMGQIDPHWIAEFQRRGGYPMGLNPAPLPGMYAPPMNLSSDLLRERERIGSDRFAARLADPLAAERLAAAGIQEPLLRLQAGTSAYTHAHAHTHTHLHLHETGNPTGLQSASMFPPGLYPGMPPPHSTNPAVSVAGETRDTRDHPALPSGAVTAAHQLPPAHTLPPGHPLLAMAAAREQDLFYRELFRAGPQYVTENNILSHQFQMQAVAHHEALQRQIALERERHLNSH